MKKLSLNEFIEKSNIFHNYKYDYSLSIYINNNTKIKIICPIHDEFEQSPYHHYNHGCKKCWLNDSGNNVNSFLSKAILFHNNKYDYSLINYKNSRTPIKIICPNHGIFEQSPNTHLKCGCKKCGSSRWKEFGVFNTDEFIVKSNKIHNNKYDYSLVNYINTKTNVDIICPNHGVFTQKPATHIKGSGCPICNSSKGELKIKKWFDDNNIKYYQQHKFPKCKNIKPLPFDFYLPDFNICIEYDGELHYNFIKDKNKLLMTNKNDLIKNDFCEKNKIKLLRINYKDNIINTIENYFNIVVTKEDNISRIDLVGMN